MCSSEADTGLRAIMFTDPVGLPRINSRDEPNKRENRDYSFHPGFLCVARGLYGGRTLPQQFA